MSTRPLVGAMSAPMMLKMVVLPDPDGPMMLTNSPRRISHVMPRRACVSTLPFR